MKLIISGGGTGGHFFPALEIVRAAQERGVDTLFVGTSRGIERRYSEDISGRKIFLETLPFKGVSFDRKLMSLLQTLKSTGRLGSEVGRDFKALIFGGYPSVPVALLTLRRRRDLYIHEQNSVPSTTNRVFALFARRIFITFEHTRNYFRGEHVIRTGLPVRRSLLQDRTDKRKARQLIGADPEGELILFMGGSQGAVFLNDLALEFARRTGLRTLLICGDRDYRRVADEGKGIPNLKIFPFRRDMGLIYSAVDMAVCRSGAGTVSELALFGIPALFIPYPHAAEDHQFYNAKEIEDRGGAVVLRQEEADFERVLGCVEKILADSEEMGKRIRDFSTPRASAVILENILKD